MHPHFVSYVIIFVCCSVHHFVLDFTFISCSQEYRFPPTHLSKLLRVTGKKRIVQLSWASLMNYQLFDPAWILSWLEFILLIVLTVFQIWPVSQRSYAYIMLSTFLGLFHLLKVYWTRDLFKCHTCCQFDAISFSGYVDNGQRGSRILSRHCDGV